MNQIYLMRGQNGEKLARENNYTAIIVDALRASSTLTAILLAKPKQVMVVAELDDAYELKSLNPDAVLIGERNNLPPSGFDFGNSPVDIINAKNVIENKTVIFTTSNGAQRLVNAKSGTNDVFMGTLASKDIIARNLKDTGDIVIISAGLFGDNDFISEEDDLTGAIIAEAIMKNNDKYSINENSDIDYTATINKLKNATAEEIFLTSKHGIKLQHDNLTEDIYHCASNEPINLLPKVTGYVKLNTEIVGVYVSEY